MSGGNRHVAADWTHCDTHGKRAYFTRAAAKKVRRGHPNRKHLSVYACNAVDGRWHLGHAPTQLYRGDITRDDIYDRRTA